MELEKQWIFDPDVGNYILSNDKIDCIISYQPIVDETAIITPDDEYFILNGDHREQYEHLIDDGLESCMIYYWFNKKICGSRWSNEE